MRVTTIGSCQPAIVAGDQVIDVSDFVGEAIMGVAPRRRMPALIGALNSGGLNLEPALSRAGVPLLQSPPGAPLERPGKILVALSNFGEGVDAVAGPISIAMKLPSSVLEPDGTVILPDVKAVVFHHEAQLAVVIGTGGKNIPASRAMDHVFGFTCAININARGLGFGMGINTDSFDTFTPLGPWIVSRDEIGDVTALRLTLHVNGELREDFRISEALHPVPDLISFASRLSTLEPGDVILTGACYRGVGPVQGGDALALTIEGIGQLNARVHDPLTRRWPCGVDAGLAEAARQARRDGTPIPFGAVSVSQLNQESE